MISERFLNNRLLIITSKPTELIPVGIVMTIKEESSLRNPLPWSGVLISFPVPLCHIALMLIKIPSIQLQVGFMLASPEILFYIKPMKPECLPKMGFLKRYETSLGY